MSLAARQQLCFEQGFALPASLALHVVGLEEDNDLALLMTRRIEAWPRRQSAYGVSSENLTGNDRKRSTIRRFSMMAGKLVTNEGSGAAGRVLKFLQQDAQSRERDLEGTSFIGQFFDATPIGPLLLPPDACRCHGARSGWFRKTSTPLVDALAMRIDVLNIIE